MVENTPSAEESIYRERISRNIRECISRLNCQPILFVGSGLSKRYFSGPSWDELLTRLALKCPEIDRDFAYYKQLWKSPLVVGEKFAKYYQQWAWGSGRNQFPESMFSDDTAEEDYIKFSISEELKSVTPTTLSDVLDQHNLNELQALQSIKPHSIITTNYDNFLEVLFPDYQPIIGQDIITNPQVLLGEIFKIHGCVSAYKSLVFTQSDYENFARRKAYLSAKLLTFFSEHPLLFIGYSASDPNIQSILSDIDECLPKRGSNSGLIENLYILEWRRENTEWHPPAAERIISTKDGKSVRVNSILTSDFKWVFEEFASNPPLNSVSPKILRALLQRSYDLVRHDIPRTTVEADFEMLERAVSSEAGFAKLFGITTISRPSAASVSHPYSLTEVAQLISTKTKPYWKEAQSFIDRIMDETGKNIKLSDNRYHIKTRIGPKSTAHLYSPEFVELVKKMSRGLTYEILL